MTPRLLEVQGCDRTAHRAKLSQGVSRDRPTSGRARRRAFHRHQPSDPAALRVYEGSPGQTLVDETRREIQPALAVVAGQCWLHR